MIRRTLVSTLLASSLIASGASAAELVVRLESVSSSNGQLLVSLAASEAQWDGREEPVRRATPAMEGTVELTFEDLQPGRYAVQVLHDENDNRNMDSNMLGIPSEGYGFSNNPSVLRRAHFGEAAFEVGEAGKTVSIRLR